MPSVISYFLLAFSMSLVGIYVGLSKPLVTIFPIMLLLWLRYLIAIPFMITWFKPLPDEAPLNRKTAGLIGLNAFIGSFVFTTCMLLGIKLTSALSGGIVMAAIPAAVAILSRIFLKEKIATRTLLAIICAISGIGLLAFANLAHLQSAEQTTASDTSTRHILLGYLFLIASAFCEGSYVVIGKKLSGKVSPKRISAYMNLFGALFATPLGIYWAWGFDFTTPDLQHWGMVVFYALTASVLTVWAWMTGLKNIPASSAGIFTIFVPICSSIVGIYLGEHFGLLHALAFLLAIFGLMLVTWPQKKFPIHQSSR